MILIGLAIHVYNDRRSIKFRKTFIVLLGSLSFVNAMWFLHLISQNKTWLIGLSFGALFFAQVTRRFFERFTRGGFTLLTRSLDAVSAVWICLLATDLLFETRLVTSAVVLFTTAFFTLATCAFSLWKLMVRRHATKQKTEATRLGYLIISGLITLILTCVDLCHLAVACPSARSS